MATTITANAVPACRKRFRRNSLRLRLRISVISSPKPYPAAITAINFPVSPLAWNNLYIATTSSGSMVLGGGAVVSGKLVFSFSVDMDRARRR